MHWKAYQDRKRFLSEILDLTPECPAEGTFPISRKESHKSAHRLQQGRLLLVITLGGGNLESYGCDQIIVLIGTGVLNEATSFSLFNATQILNYRSEIIPLSYSLSLSFLSSLITWMAIILSCSMWRKYRAIFYAVPLWGLCWGWLKNFHKIPLTYLYYVI